MIWEFTKFNTKCNSYWDNSKRYITFIFSKVRPHFYAGSKKLYISSLPAVLVRLYGSESNIKLHYELVPSTYFDQSNENYYYSYHEGQAYLGVDIYFDKNKIYKMLKIEPSYISILCSAFENINKVDIITPSQWCYGINFDDNIVVEHWAEKSSSEPVAPIATPDTTIYGNTLILSSYEILDFKAVMYADLKINIY